MAQDLKSFPNNAKYFFIPTARFTLMCILTWGLFEAYWIYKNWQYIKQRDNLDIHPFWRGIFSIFFIHGIMEHIRDDSELNSIQTPKFSVSGLAMGWIILNVLGNVLNKFNDPMLNLASIALFIPTFIFILPVQNYINDVNYASNPQPDYHDWSAGQVICLVFGIILSCIFLIALLSPLIDL